MTTTTTTIAGEKAHTWPTSAPARNATVQDLLHQRNQLPAGHPDRAILRARSVLAGLPLARRLATRYRGRGEPFEDLYQVAALALVKAVDNYDPALPAAFNSYAIPNIVGSLKRHFRDTTWRVRPPRRIQELAISLTATSARLAQQLGRSPTRSDLAAHLDVTDADVAIGLHAWQAYRPDSLDALSFGDGEDRRPLSDTIGAIDTRIEQLISRQSLRPLLAALSPRDQRILAMRYFDDMTQSEIAAEIGVSQMQISRLLRRSLTRLREGLLAQ